jgi:3-oxoacyl-[acyl-carrier-protein] synthase II
MNAGKRRVVVTGMGTISPMGYNVADSWANIKAGKSGISHIEAEDTSPIGVHIGGEVKGFDATQYMDKRAIKRTDRAQQFALIAAKQALDDSGFVITDENCYDVGCIIGSGIGSIRTLEAAFKGFASKGQRGVSVLMVAPLLSDQLAAQVSIDYNVRGPNYTVITACATGNNAIGDAADIIRLGRAKMMLAGGSEACLINMVLSGFDNMKALTHYDGEPAHASRPFDARRDGFVAAEGAAVLMLEDLEHAQARGAHIYAEVTGYGNTSDAYHVTAPRDDGEAAAKAMELALADANLTIKDLSYVNAHGTGTPLNDSAETLAIKKAFGEDAYTIPVSSTKSMTGHMLGAAGAFEAIVSIMAIRDGFMPPTMNYEVTDPDCDLDYIPNVGREKTVNHVMSNSFGFGGHNAVLVISRYQD